MHLWVDPNFNTYLVTRTLSILDLGKRLCTALGISFIVLPSELIFCIFKSFLFRCKKKKKTKLLCFGFGWSHRLLFTEPKSSRVWCLAFMVPSLEATLFLPSMPCFLQQCKGWLECLNERCHWHIKQIITAWTYTQVLGGCVWQLKWYLSHDWIHFIWLDVGVPNQGTQEGTLPSLMTGHCGKHADAAQMKVTRERDHARTCIRNH